MGTSRSLVYGRRSRIVGHNRAVLVCNTVISVSFVWGWRPGIVGHVRAEPFSSLGRVIVCSDWGFEIFPTLPENPDIVPQRPDCTLQILSSSSFTSHPTISTIQPGENVSLIYISHLVSLGYCRLLWIGETGNPINILCTNIQENGHLNLEGTARCKVFLRKTRYGNRKSIQLAHNRIQLRRWWALVFH